MEAVARRSLASGWRNAPGMALGGEDFVSDDTDFRCLLADVPPDSAPEPPVRQGRRVANFNNQGFLDANSPRGTPRLMALKPICFAKPRESPFSTLSQSAGGR
jgi:hypothetical protein